MNNPLDLFAWKVRSERKRQHLTQKQLAERLGMNPRTIIDLETCQSNPKFETVVLVAKELNISVDAAIFPEMVNQTVSKTVVDFFAGKSEAEIENLSRSANRRKSSRKTSNAVGFDVPGRVTVSPVCYAGSLFFFCFVSIFQMLEGLLADDMLHPAGVLFRRYRVYASLDQPVGKEAVLFVDLLRHFPAHVGQVQEIVAVHCQEAPVPQGRHRMAHAGL